MKSSVLVIGKVIIFITLILASMIFSSCSIEEDETLVVEYYYYNSCASCEPEKEFLEDFESITGISRTTVSVEVKTYNVFTEEGEKVWQKLAKKMGVSEDADFPVLKVGDELIYISDTEITAENDTVSIVAFISSDCTACEQASDTILESVPEITVINGVEYAVDIRIVTLTTSTDKEMFSKYCSAYHIKEEMQMTPIVFVGRTGFCGMDEIEKLSDYLESSFAFKTVTVQ